MIYRDFQDVKLSALGMGAMRLPVVDGDDSKIDEAAAFAMVDEAMARGVNYYDTAWGYHNGNSELVMGKALARHPREKFYLATKFPATTCPTWARWRRFSRSSWRNARWSTSTSTCSTTCAR